MPLEAHRLSCRGFYIEGDKMYYIDVKDIAETGTYIINGDSKNTIEVTEQKTGFGYKLFLVCPRCGARRTKLYMQDNNLICRSCIPMNIYEPIQNGTKGGTRYIDYRMRKIARKYGIKIVLPFNYITMALSRPKYVRCDTWEKVARQLQVLQSFRAQSIYCGIGKHKIYSVKEINYVLNNCLYVYDLDELYDYMFGIDWTRIIEWHKGLDKQIEQLKIERK